MPLNATPELLDDELLLEELLEDELEELLEEELEDELEELLDEEELLLVPGSLSPPPQPVKTNVLIQVNIDR